MLKALQQSVLIGLLLAPCVELHAQDQSVPAGADWLLTQQLPSGAFPWTVGGPMNENSQGATARSLLIANGAAPTVAYVNAAVRTGNFLINSYPLVFSDGDPNIRPLDTLFLEELSFVTGDPTYANFLQTYLWDKLKTSSYGQDNNQNTAAWAAALPGFPEYPWPAMDPLFRAAPAIAAHYAGELQIRDALMANIVVELNQTTTSTKLGDLTGLAAAIWASAHTGINLDPTSGRWASRNSTQDLVNTLVGYQRAGGDFPYDTSSAASKHVGDVAVTADAVTALSAWNRAAHTNAINRALQFIRGLQQPSGQILTNPGYPADTETAVLVHAVALIALGSDDGTLLDDVVGNQPPLASADAASTDRGVPVVINVLANDSDSDGTLDATSVVVTSATAHGTAVANPSNGTITYTPAANYVGPDSFRYTVEDDAGATSNEATVSLTVVGVSNQPPVAVNDAASTDRGVPVVLNVLANDSDSDGTLDATSVVVTLAPAHGTASVNPSNGTITYTPAANYVGADSFRYTVEDNDGASSNQATVSVTVTGVPTTFTFTPVADTHVYQAQPTVNFGSASVLQVRQTSTQSYISYLRFVVSGLGGAVQSARLRVYVQSGGNETATLYQASNNYLGTANPWTEAGLNWNNADRSGTVLGTTTMANGTWREFVVTPTVVGPGTYAFALINAPTRLSSFQSRENVNAPQLVIDTAP